MWRFVLQDPLGQTLSVLSGARSRHLDYKRSATPEASFELDLAHDDAQTLADALAAGGGGLPRLRALREELQGDGTSLRVCRFAGTAPILEEKAAAGIVAVTFRGAFEVLEGRFTDDLFARDLTPAGDIAVDLLDLTETLDGPTGIYVGSVEVTEPRDATYEALKRISDGIIDLADAFDFEVVPVADETGQGSDLGRLDIWVAQGQDRPGAIFGYGDATVANCDDANRKTTPPRNRVWVTGDEGLVGFAEDVDSQDRFGVWGDTFSMSNTLDQNVLDGRAQALLRPMPVTAVTFDPDPSKVDSAGEAITPSPWRDYWLGDTVALDVRKGAFVYDGQPRIDGVAIDIDDDGNEAGHSITVAAENVG